MFTAAHRLAFRNLRIDILLNNEVYKVKNYGIVESEIAKGFKTAGARKL